MKADKIIKNAKIFTADKDRPIACALAVKDGKFVYVGDEAGLSDYEGDVSDLGGKFVMPAVIDSHVHVTTGVGFAYIDTGEYIMCGSKKEALDFMAENIKNDPGRERYKFILERKYLQGEDLTKEDLDAVCPEAELLILEGEGHSVWANSKILERHGITDDTPDPVPELSYYVRKDGHITGNVFESSGWNLLFDGLSKITDEQIDAQLERWIDYSVKTGVCAVFDAGYPEGEELHERVYERLCRMDKQGKLPIYIDGSYALTHPKKVKEVVDQVKRFREKFNTQHLKVHTFKIFMDGTLRIETAALVTPYTDTGKKGAVTLNEEEVAEVMKILNDEGLDFHAHTVGEQASRTVLNGVEKAKKELGENFRVKVTCAHLEIQDDTDLDRFSKLGVNANYTPWWHSGCTGGDPYKLWCSLLGEERANKMYRCKTLWDTGANVTWSSDNITYGDFASWNPYLGMEVGMTRYINEKTKSSGINKVISEFPPETEKMGIEEMILGYTVNGAKQLGIEATKGSIEVGKDADFLVFENDLLTAEHEGFSHNKPSEVYFCGKKMN
ncbi:MAG: amidohydrolase family protein [Firmicutes bacterium]|nr:amidohydrolase family protein [Bacillota bacterium]